LSIKMLVLGDCASILQSSDVYIPLSSTLAGGFFPRVFDDLDAIETEYIGVCLPGLFLTHKKSSKVQNTQLYLNTTTFKEFGLDNASSYDLMIGKEDALIVHPQQLECSVKQHLQQAFSVSLQDLERLIAILGKEFPNVYEHSMQYLSSNTFWEHPLCILRRDLFDEFRLFLNQIVKLYYAQLDIPSLQTKRLASFQSFMPMLLHVYLQSYPSLRCTKVSTVRFLQHSTPLTLEKWREDSVGVVFAANEKFAPALGVCLASLLDHSNAARLYDIVVLESDMSNDSKSRLENLCASYNNVLLRFYNPKAMLHNRKLQKNPTDHISMETYYRFLIADILPSYEKVLYLDCDTVILEDAAKLYDIDLGEYLLAAALDVEMPALSSGIDPTLSLYLKNVLHLDDTDPYLQAGVLVLNLSSMRVYHSVDDWLLLAGERKYRYNDQDLLNKECKGRFKILPLVYNTVIDCDNRRVNNLLHGPYALYDEYLKARENPKIVHYAGFQKPWDDPGSDFAYLFWHYAQHSEFYDRLLAMVQEGRKPKKLSDRLLPRGSKRRDLVKQLMYRLSNT